LKKTPSRLDSKREVSCLLEFKSDSREASTTLFLCSKGLIS
jgi:hypothetical protein